MQYGISHVSHHVHLYISRNYFIPESLTHLTYFSWPPFPVATTNLFSVCNVVYLLSLFILSVMPLA